MMEEELDVSSLKKSIDEIETVLRHSRNSTVDAVNAFESFSNSVEGVRKELDPIIVLTQKLMVSQRNINSTMTAFSKIQSHFDVLERVEPILDNVKLEDTIEKKALLKSIDQLWESLVFLRKNPELQTAGFAQKRMEALLEKGLEDLSTEYATHLAKTCPHVQDYLQQSGSPLERFDERISLGLRNIANCLARNGFADKLLKRIYVDPRSAVMFSTLQQRAEEVWHIRKKPNANAAKVRKGSFATDLSEDIVDANTDGGSEAKGDEDKHGFVEFIQLLLSILSTERQIAEKVLPANLAVILFLHTTKECASYFETVSANYALKQVEKQVSKTQRLFVYAQVFKAVQDTEATFATVLNASGLTLPQNFTPPSLMELGYPSSTILSTLFIWKQAAVEELKSVSTTLCLDTDKMPRNCTVHIVSSRTINFVRRMCKEKDVISALCRYLSSDTSEPFKTKVVEILENLKVALEEKARTNRSSTSQAWLFLANNYLYIWRELQTDDLLLMELGEDYVKTFNDYYEQSKSKYVDALANRLLQYVFPNGEMLSIELRPGRNEPTAQSKRVVVDAMGNVNRWIEEVYDAQKGFCVPDPDMRVELRYRIRETILPKFKTVFAKIASVGFSKRKKEKMLRYSPDRLSHMISQFYELSE